MGALLQQPAAHGVTGRFASDPSRSCGLTARGVGGRGASNGNESTLYTPKCRGGITVKGT